MKRLLLLVLFFISLSLSAQRIKYKDLLPMIRTSDEEQSVMLIKEYLQIDAEHPHANFLLAQVYKKRYRRADLLTSYEMAVANAEQAKLRYLKCQTLVSEREVRRNDEYFQDSKGSPIPWAVIEQEMKTSYDSAGIFLQKVPDIYANFTKSVTYFDRTIKNYAAIAGIYKKLNRETCKNCTTRVFDECNW